MNKRALSVEDQQEIRVANGSRTAYGVADMDADFRDFLRNYPAYEATGHLDDLRAREYGRLDAQGQIYLDFTGGGLYADCQLREHMQMLSRNVYGNPHSANPTSL